MSTTKPGFSVLFYYRTMFAATVQNNYLCVGKVALPGSVLRWDDYWIQVRDFWVEISKKVGQPNSFCIALDLATLEGSFSKTGIQNSIYLETTPYTGSFGIYISTTNRLDIIQLFQSIKKGQKILSDAISRRQIEKSCRFDVETASGFLGLGKERLVFQMTPNSLDINGQKGSALHYELPQILHITPKQNDQNCHTRISIALKENEVKEFNCLEHSAMLNAVSCFIYNTRSRIEQENRANPNQ